jgi:5-aminolevulinate synthase
VNYREILKSKLNQLKSESRYRTFIELERQTGWHPHALWNSPDGPKDVVIWCSNDYLGMGQNP